METRFIQGSGYPTLYRYSTSGTLIETIRMPYVRDDGKSYIRQKLIPYPENKTLQHKMLNGEIIEDSPVGYILEIEIKYNTIEKTILLKVINSILEAKQSGFLKLKPRHDYNSDENIYRVIIMEIPELKSQNAWQHTITLKFQTQLLSPSTRLHIPPLLPS